MKSFRRKNRITFLLILLLVITIGYAAISTQLKINGAVSVSKTTWDVHFENVEVTNGSVEANPAPTSNNTDTTEMTYTINFTKPGDYYEFTVDVVNKGTLDAMVDIVTNKSYSSNGTTEITLPNYLTSSVTYDGGAPISEKQLLAKNTSEKIRVRVEFKKDISASDLPSSGNATVVFKFKGIYSQADETAEEVINPCPGCVYAYPRGEIDDIKWGKEGSILTPNQYKTDFHDLVAETGKKRFVGMILNDSNKVTRGFACGIHNNGNLFCGEAVILFGDDYYTEDVMNQIYQRNKKVLQSPGLWNNTCEDEEGVYLECTGDETIHATIGDHTYVIDDTGTCYADYNGGLNCFEANP